jgi:hypothetical protein
MSEKRGMFEHETFTNFLWFAILIGGALLLTLIVPRLTRHSHETRPVAGATPTPTISN